MASYFSYPGFAPPQPYAQTPDISGDFFRALQSGQNVRNEGDAQQSLTALGQGLEAPSAPGKQSLADFGLPAREVLLPMLQNPATRQQAFALIQDATGKRDQAADPMRQLQLQKAQYDVAHQGDVAPTAEMRNFAMTQQNPAFADFVGASGMQNAPDIVKQYAFYRKGEIDAGRQPLGFLDFKNTGGAPDKNGGLIETSPNATLFDPVTRQPVFTAPAGADAAPGAPELPTVSFNDRGAPDPQQQAQFLQALDPGTASLVKGIADYQLDPTKTTSMRGDQRQKMIGLVQQYDPTFDMSQYGARAAARKAYTTGQQGQTITSANTVIGHLSNLADDAEKLGNGDFMPFNMASNAVKGAMSNPDLAKFNSDKMAVASELAKFFKGTGASDLTTTQEWQSVFDQNTGPGALKAVVTNVIGDLMKSRLDEMRSQFTMAMGKPSDFRFITPETDKVLTKLGIDTNAIDPTFASIPSGPGPSGKVLTYNAATGELE